MLEKYWLFLECAQTTNSSIRNNGDFDEIPIAIKKKLESNDVTVTRRDTTQLIGYSNINYLILISFQISFSNSLEGVIYKLK